MKGSLVKIRDEIAVASDRSPLQCGSTGEVRETGEYLQVFAGSSMLRVLAADVVRRPDGGWKRLQKPGDCRA